MGASVSITGRVLTVGAETFVAVDAHGHTPGSTAWLFGDVLFTGDAALGGDNVAASPWFFDDDNRQARETVKALMSLDFKTMLDGHRGQTDNAQEKLR